MEVGKTAVDDCRRPIGGSWGEGPRAGAFSLCGCPGRVYGDKSMKDMHGWGGKRVQARALNSRQRGLPSFFFSERRGPRRRPRLGEQRGLDEEARVHGHGREVPEHAAGLLSRLLLLFHIYFALLGAAA